MSDVTVLLPTFNRAAYVRQSIESVLRQTRPPCQIIVIDDGSTDETEQALAPFCNQIEYIRKGNGGKGSALNAGLPLVKGRYIWVFDDDDVACDDTLERHLAALERRPDAGFSYGGYFMSRSEPGTHALVVMRPRPPRPFADTEHFIENLLCCYLPSPAVLVRTHIQQRAGPYHEDLRRVDDFEMSIRWGLLAPAARLADISRPTFHQRQHSGVRGRQDLVYDNRDSVLVARVDARKALRGLAQTIELRHYLPCDCWDQALDDSATVRAMVRRWAVHMQSGMWPEAFADCAILAEQPVARLDRSGDVARFGMRAFQDVHMLRELASDGAVMQILAEWLRKPNLVGLKVAAARQFYYRMLADRRAGAYADLARHLKVAACVLGWAQFPATLLGHRLRRLVGPSDTP